MLMAGMITVVRKPTAPDIAPMMDVITLMPAIPATMPAMSGMSGATTGAMVWITPTIASIAPVTTGATVSTTSAMVSNAVFSGPPMSGGRALKTSSMIPGSDSPRALNALRASSVRFSARPPSRSPVFSLNVPNIESTSPLTALLTCDASPLPMAVRTFCHADFVAVALPSSVPIASLAVVPAMPMFSCTAWMASTIVPNPTSASCEVSVNCSSSTPDALMRSTMPCCVPANPRERLSSMV